MALYKFILAYDGTQYNGFQAQATGKNRQTVQNVVENALRQVGWQGKHILAAGRTDRGVHAFGQVIACDLEWKHSVLKLRSALNAHLPADIAIREAVEVVPGFHPRYSAQTRSYRYQMFCSDVRNPLLERFAWRVWPAADLETMIQASQELLGEHDFAAFGNAPKPGGSTIRQIFRTAWKTEEIEPSGNLLSFEICANGFLYHMVRRIVAYLVMIGQGGMTLEEFQMAIRGTARLAGKKLAPAQGLFLFEVVY